MALGSLYEIHNQLIIAKDVGYLNQDQYSKLVEQLVTVRKLTIGLIKKIKNNTNF